MGGFTVKAAIVPYSPVELAIDRASSPVRWLFFLSSDLLKFPQRSKRVTDPSDSACTAARNRLLTVVGLAAMVVFASMLLFACAAEVGDGGEVIERGPVGADRYEAILLEGSGSEIQAEALARWGREVAEEIEQVMDRVASLASRGEGAESAAGVGGDGGGDVDWKTVFRLEMERRPSDVASTLERYRTESARAEKFVREKDLMTLPDVELRVTEAQNVIIRQSFPLALYSNGQLAVTTSATEDPDPELPGKLTATSAFRRLPFTRHTLVITSASGILAG